jgi:hypothetical protein
LSRAKVEISTAHRSPQKRSILEDSALQQFKTPV